MTTPVARIARPAWPLVAGVGLALSVAALTAMPAYYRSRAVRLELASGAFHASPASAAIVVMSLTMLPTVFFFAVALVVRYRSAPGPMGLICAYVLVLFASGVVGPVPWIVYGGAPPLMGSPALTAAGRLATPLGLFAFGVFFAVFPSGSFVPRWLRWLTLVAAVCLAGGIVLAATGSVDAASSVFQLTGLGFLIGDAAAQVYRYRHVSAPVQRQQTKWVLLGLAGAVAVVGVNQLIWTFMPRRVTTSALAQNLDGAITWQLAFTLIAVGIGIAVLRFRLWDVDLVINRALLYTCLTAAVVAIYVLVVGYLGRALRTQTTLWMSLVATGIVAVIIQPLRGLLERNINRLTYGQRDEPYTVVTELGRRLATALDHQPLVSAVETLAAALKLHYVAIAVRDGDGEAIAAEHGQAATDEKLLALPLEYHSAEVGQLLVGQRRRGEPLTPRDTQLLREG